MIRVRVFSRFEENVAIHEANFVKSKRYRVAKECEIVGGPSLYIILYCAVLCYTVLIILYALTVQTVMYTNSLGQKSRGHYVSSIDKTKHNTTTHLL